MVNQLSNTANNRELTNIALSFGGDNTLAMADISTKSQALGVDSMARSSYKGWRWRLVRFNYGFVGGKMSLFSQLLAAGIFSM